MNDLISLFASAKEVEPDRLTTLPEFLRNIRDGLWADRVAAVRRHLKSGDRKRYDEAKRHLPGATLSCACVSRQHQLSPEAKAVRHSGWLQCDFDGKENGQLFSEDVSAEMRRALESDPHVAAVFVGPSGEGLKAVARIDPERHAESWAAAEAHFRERYGLRMDRSTKDAMRLCFVSHDPLATWSDQAEPIPVPEGPARAADGPWMPPVETTAEDVAEMLSFVPPRPDYDTWLRVASAVWSVLPLEAGCAALAAWSPEEKEGEYASKHRHRLAQIGVGTLVHLAAQNGFDARAAWRRKRWAGRIRFADRAAGPTADPAADTAPPRARATKEVSREEVKDALDHGQVGDARLWCEMRAGLRLWNYHAQVWMIYDRGIWRRDEGATTVLDISDTLTALYEAAAEPIRREIKEKPAPDPKKDRRAADLKSIAERRASLCSWQYLRQVENIARVHMQIGACEFDARPDLLALDNGVIDFTEGVFREHRPGDYLTHRSPIAFDPDAECPMWNEFLGYFMAEKAEMMDYLARAVGYSLTGRVHEDALFFLYGKGANGKSTFMAALKMILGDLMTTVPIAALLASKSDSNFDYHKSSMEGRRIVMTDELPEGRTLHENQVKSLVGGDRVPARRPYEKPYEFEPTHKLWMAGNHKLKINGTDHGIWRRIHFVPWTVTISDAKRRPRHEVLADFRRELPGILNWAIRGYLESERLGGLTPPPTVVEATKEYRAEEDVFGQFLEECIERVDTLPISMTKTKDIRSTYATWCEQNGEVVRHRSTQAVRKAMAERGYQFQEGRDRNQFAVGVIIKATKNDTAFSLVS